MTLQAGTRFGPYKLLSPLGTGGLGELYRARESKLGREIARRQGFVGQLTGVGAFLLAARWLQPKER
jgi:hypothetical protein